LCLALE